MQLAVLLSCMFLSVHAYAYIGPGAGLTAIGTVIALIAAFFLAIVGFVWYPVKRLLRKNKSNPSKENASELTGRNKTSDK